MGQLSAMTKEVVEWIRPLLNDEIRDSVNTSIKLSEEAAELTHALYTKGDNVGEECADVLILLLDIAYLNGIDLSRVFSEKMAENRARKWNKEKGCLKHENTN